MRNSSITAEQGFRTDKQRGLRRLAGLTNRRQDLNVVGDDQRRRLGGHQFLHLRAQTIRCHAAAPGVVRRADDL
jgi:hypothetical protein